MAGSSFDGNKRCATCGATIPEASDACPTCAAAPTPLTNAPQAPAPVPVPVPVPRESQIDPNPYAVSLTSEISVAPTFRLSTLMLTITLISVCLGVGTWFPGIGVGLALLATPAYLRTVLAGVRLRHEGKPPTIEEKIFIFFASLAIVVSIVVAVVVAFYGTCWVGFMGGMFIIESVQGKGLDALGPSLLIGMALGVIAGIAAIFFTIRGLWPYRKF